MSKSNPPARPAQTSRERALSETVRAFAESNFDPEEVLRRIAVQAAEALGDRCAIVSLSADGAQVAIRAGHHLDPEGDRFLRSYVIGVSVPAAGTFGAAVSGDGRPLLVPTVDPEELASNYAGPLKTYFLRFPIYTVISVPLTARGRRLGVLSVGRDRPGNPYGAGDLEFATELAYHAAVAIELAQSFEAERQARLRAEALASRMALLARASREFAAAGPHLPGVLESIVSSVAETVGDACALALLSEDGTSLVTKAIHHADPEAAEQIRRLFLEQTVPAHAGPRGQAIASGRSIRIEAVPERFAREIQIEGEKGEFLRRYPIRSVIDVPLKSGQGVIGVMAVTRHRDGVPFTLEDQEFLEDLGDRAALAIVNARLYEGERAAREQLRRVADAIPILIAFIDSGYRYQYVNRALADWIGRPRSEIEGRRLVDIVGPEVFETAKPRIDVALSGRVEHQEGVARDPGGIMRDLSVSYLPQEDSSGRVVGLVAVVVDMTDERKTHQQLREAVQIRDEFLSIAAHELRTPLTSLQLQLQVVERSMREAEAPGVDGRMLGRVGVAMRQTDRLARLIEELLNVARISSGRFELDRQPVDLVALVAETVERMSADAARAGSALHFEPADPIIGRWDRLRIEQVVTNLISNAIRYGLGRPIQVQVELKGGVAVLTVRDHGIGIPAEAMERIFDRFARAVTDRHYGGLGLGLYVAKQIVAAHGGTVRVDSAPGQGATFGVELPDLLEPGGQPGEAAPVPGRPEGERKHTGREFRARVMVVEDDADARETLVQLLEGEGYDVTQAENGKRALDVLAAAGVPDLIVLDLRMPVMDGLAFGIELRNRPEGRSIPILLLSADSQGPELSGGLGPAGFIRKPVELEDLLSAVERALPARIA